MNESAPHFLCIDNRDKAAIAKGMNYWFMRKLFIIAFSVLLLDACYDDSELRSDIEEMKSKIERLEKMCELMNGEILSVQSIVDAIEKRDYISSYERLSDGYMIILGSGKNIVIRNGKDGTNGVDGKDGKDGYSPKISLRRDVDGVCYWSLDGNWLLDESGKKIPVSGQDGVTPKLKIDGGFWYVTYDNISWTKLGKATGDSGKDATQFFKSIEVKNGYVYFVINDSDETTISIPLQEGGNVSCIKYVPGYSDGCARVPFMINMGQIISGTFQLRFEVNGIQAANTILENWHTRLSAKVVYTETATKAEVGEFADISISNVSVSGSIANVSLSSNLISDDFFNGAISASVRVAYQNSNDVLLSDYIPIIPLKGDVLYQDKENGVSGFGVDIDGVVWAPYNCGVRGSMGENAYGSLYTLTQAFNACPDGWWLPNVEQLESLSKHYSEMKQYKGLIGRSFSGKSEYSSTSKSVFFPAAGYKDEKGQIYDEFERGVYWSCSGAILSVFWDLDFSNSDVRTSMMSSARSCSVRCVRRSEQYVPVESVVLDNSEITLAKGDLLSIKATIIPSNATTKKVKWLSSDSNVVDVSDDGKVYAVGEGYANVTAFAENKLATCRVKVIKPDTSNNYIDENGIDRGIGVLFNNLVWAPVNCGMTDNTDGTYGKYYQYSKSFNNCPKGWRLPTWDELSKLIQTSSEMTIQNGVKGRYFKNNGQQLFLPAAGFEISEAYPIQEKGDYGYYLSSQEGLALFFDSQLVGVYQSNDGLGLSVRCVKE